MDSKFSYDVKMEILSRASLKTLDTMRCTSQEFQKLAYDSYFLKLYKQRNDIVYGFLLVNLKNSDYTTKFAPSPHSHTSLDLAFLPPKARILASSEQGIMVFQTPHSKYYWLLSYHVCKPATKQLFTLPNPKTKYLTKNVAMLVLASKPLHYKIIRLSEPKTNKRGQECTIYCYEIFDSRAWIWRLMDPVVLPYSIFLSNEQPITTRGSIYMPLSNYQVLKFEAHSEKWTIFSPPIQIQTLDYEANKEFVKYKGKLGFICETQSRVYCKIWVLRSSNDDSWEKLHVLETRDDIERSSLEAIYDDSDKSVMITAYNNTLHPYRIFTFRSDFEPI